eukprot:357293-Chlamydomonas_euryale.AAC.7
MSRWWRRCEQPRCRLGFRMQLMWAEPRQDCPSHRLHRVLQPAALQNRMEGGRSSGAWPTFQVQKVCKDRRPVAEWSSIAYSQMCSPRYSCTLDKEGVAQFGCGRISIGQGKYGRDAAATAAAAATPFHARY